MLARLTVLAVLAGGLLAVSGGATGQPPAADKEKEKEKAPAWPTQGAARTVGLLHNERLSYDRITETAVFEILQRLTGQYGLTFVIRDKAFRDAGVENFGESRPNLSTTRLDGLTLHRLLTLVLTDLGAA